MAFFNKFFKKIKIPALVLILLLTAIAPALVLAACTPPAGGSIGEGTGFPNPLCSTSIYCFLKGFINILLKIGIIVAAVFIIYSGFLFVTAGGDTAALKNARTAFVGAVIGTAVLLGSWLIATVLNETVGQVTGSKFVFETCP
ncbi:MAG: hypothetical protein UX94_C0005G0028 [Parcubacteria group bacterium GW2011_GWA2_47_21]|nr:MAG: hypothetical protein UX94_C0005G0028 [Parcubacteria group bacterium GW2011_GWA2_47_21]